jgi:hypothetical protein
LSLFGIDNFQGNLAKGDRFSGFEELDENDNPLFYHQLKDKLISTSKQISDDKI